MNDFEAYLDPEFQAPTFARDLLVATNGPDADELEVETAIKRLRFDVDECDKRMSSIAGHNYQELVGNFDRIQQLQKVMDSRVAPAVDRINSSFDRINAEVVQPYEEAANTNAALKRIHTTLAMLRGVSVFMVIVQQLEELTSEPSSLPKQARLLHQLQQVLDDQSTLNQIRLVRNYQPIATSKRQSLVNECGQSITSLVSHAQTFTTTNSELKYRMQALYLVDPEEFKSAITKIVTKNVTSASAQLQRALNSPRNFPEILGDIKTTQSQFFDTLEEIIAAADSEDDEIDLKSAVSDDLIGEFWSKLALRFKKNIAATMARGGPIAKNLRSYHDGIVNSVNKTFEGEVQEQLVDALSLIKGER
ncbi:hypothetical protein DIURU_003687 [Diutina rugosa]|uniref:Conserved oligomeric Golgi complex subunit 5 n=1 Tax=Diutina rugosa TaxID=5481 RepID=A0A642UKJ8_DIURU|nr:uncharacterized protein DIURU_003687 [Diutina rugosa]KAA8900705.1 hypothetical protein DIURU_003687 [Diutina rugosa]